MARIHQPLTTKSPEPQEENRMMHQLIENWYAVLWGTALIVGYVGSCMSTAEPVAISAPENGADANADSESNGWDPVVIERAQARAEEGAKYGL